ncbi:PEP-CTERM motif protein [Planctomycetes bacterium MalM25]|nr:PEP-CTERM motif protein [Planctomycetes bacterium MalM25]
MILNLEALPMKRLPLLCALSALAFASSANAATIVIETLGFNTNGVAFDATNEANASGELLNGAAFPGANVAGMTHDITLTYNNLDLDGDTTANDSVTFTINVTNPGPGLLFNQGLHTNWGTVEGMDVSVSGVSGVTTDGGAPIVFDGFVGAALGAGDGSGTVDRSATINGIPYSLMASGGTGFVFVQDFQDFAPVATLQYRNSGGTQGTLVARNWDLQFSTAIPEPTTLGLLGLGMIGFAARRR